MMSLGPFKNIKNNKHDVVLSFRSYERYNRFLDFKVSGGDK